MQVRNHLPRYHMMSCVIERACDRVESTPQSAYILSRYLYHRLYPAQPKSMLYSREQLNDLDDYDLVKEVGQGRRCVIYEAVCRRGRMRNRLLALKKITLPGLPDRANREVIEYAKMQQELYHPNILSLYSTFFSLDVYVQVMEYCPEGNLAEYMKFNNLSSLPKSMLFSLFKGLSNALAYLKDRDIVHRAIHPTNIYLGPDQRPKLTCFENAIRLPSAWAPLPLLTDYTSPEITQGSPGSFPADIWSLACVVYYSLTGQSPQICRKVPVKTAMSSLDCDSQLRDLLVEMLNCSPSDRLSIGNLVTHQIFGHPARAPTNQVTIMPSPEDDVMVKRQTLVPVSGFGRNYEHALGQKPRASVMRRVSLDGVGDVRLERPPSDYPAKNDGLRFHTTKRIVSDPIPHRGTRYAAAPVQDSGTVNFVSRGLSKLPSPKISGAVSPPMGIRTASNALPGVCSSAGHGTDSGTLPKMDSSFLRPQSQRSREGQVSILRNRHVLVDFRNSSMANVATNNKVMIINPKQDLINIYEGPILHDQLSDPVYQYSRVTLPTDFWYQYRAAFIVIDQMKQRTSKFIMFTDDGKYTQMANGPPSDVEATFSPIPVSQKSEQAQDDSAVLRIRYSEARSLLEFRRYVGEINGRSWMKKSIVSISNLRAIPQTEWDKLDDIEKHCLYRLIIFAETCKMIEDLNLATRSLAPLQDTGLENQGEALPSATVAEHVFNIPSVGPFPGLLIPRRPNKLFETRLDTPSEFRSDKLTVELRG